MRIFFLILLIQYGAIGMCQNKINNYEYWFDHNTTSIIRIPVNPVTTLQLDTGIIISGLNNGLHSIHFRFADNNAQYSALTSQFFYKYTSPVFSPKQINSYQYWFDGNFTSGYRQNITPSAVFTLNDSLGLSTLSEGLHTFSVRFFDNEGESAGTLTQFFYKYSATVFSNKQITGFQYWFDDNISASITPTMIPASVFTLADSLDLTALHDGLHSFSIRYKDSRGEWSGVVTQFFYKPALPVSTASKLTGYEYWFDTDYDHAIKTSVTTNAVLILNDSVNINSLSEGLHTFSIRFKDDAGKWSSTVAQFFYTAKKDTASANQITGYRYWFDNRDSSLNLVNIVPFMNPYLMDAEIPLDGVDSGRHAVHFQFIDANGKWSMVTTDSTATTLKATYTFNGNGNWSDAANWVNKIKPPLVINGTYNIFIDPVSGGHCVLDVEQHITTGAVITVKTGKSLIIPGNLQIHQQ